MWCSATTDAETLNKHLPSITLPEHHNTKMSRDGTLYSVWEVFHYFNYIYFLQFCLLVRSPSLQPEPLDPMTMNFGMDRLTAWQFLLTACQTSNEVASFQFCSNFIQIILRSVWWPSLPTKLWQKSQTDFHPKDTMAQCPMSGVKKSPTVDNCLHTFYTEVFPWPANIWTEILLSKLTTLVPERLHPFHISNGSLYTYSIKSDSFKMEWKVSQGTLCTRQQIMALT